MFKKIILSEFLTTVNFSIFIKTIYLLTFRLPFFKYGKEVCLLEKSLLNYIGVKKSKIISFYNGRSAICHCLKLIKIKEDDEVIVSGYTCVSVSNAVIQSGAKIVYIDINKNNLGIDIKKLESNINKKTKVIIIQHTFGKPSSVNEIIKIAKKNNVLVIEDCAHSLGSEYKGKKLGSFGDFSIFSTGRDKVISSVTGGFLIINNKKYSESAKEIKKKLIMPSNLLISRNLFYNIFGYISYKTYGFLSIGKVVMYISRKFNIITEILTKEEKNLNYKKFNYLLPNSLAYLALGELKKIDIYNKHRNKISFYYDNKINKSNKVYFLKKDEYNNNYRYPFICKNEKEKKSLLKYMKKNNILLGKSWSGINIVPYGTSLDRTKYKLGTCKIAENISKNITFLPNHNSIKIKDAKKIINLINKFYSKKSS
ncbi:hypothetical protein CSB07_01040 [Candidatus Gracilibacteria bacterium]|nr:MAG: hypothetical protein CSB07_01040 [Candidatus Gracilibacteria bacterium]PIE84902.1 MAG: hypothetical protein CSA08_04750 [Candidatus Gracilibacteria bacterium]